jgi:hypothetical protein
MLPTAPAVFNLVFQPELLNVTKTQTKPEVQPGAVSDNRGGKMVAAIGRRKLGSNLHAPHCIMPATDLTIPFPYPLLCWDLPHDA